MEPTTTSVANARLTIGATLGYWLAVGSLRSFISIRLVEIGASMAFLGVLIAVSPLAGLILAIPCGRLVDRLGARLVALAGASAMAVIGLLYSVTGTVSVMLILQLLSGAAEMALWVALQSLITMDRITSNARHIALFSIVWGLGATTGPLIGGFLFEHFEWFGLSLFYAAAAFGALAVFWIRDTSGTRQPGSKPNAPIRSIMRDFLKDPAVRAILTSSFIVQVVVGARQSYYPVYLQERGLSVVLIGVLLSLLAFTSLLVRPLTPWLMRLRPASWWIVVSVWVSIVGLAVTPLPGALVLVIGAMLMGIGLGMNTILGVYEMAENTEPETRGMAMATRMLVNRAAHVSQPLSFAALASVAGLGATFPGVAAVLAIGGVATGRDFRRSGGREAQRGGGDCKAIEG